MIAHILLTVLMVFLLSCNVNGLRSGDKINSFFASVQADIICLQETRWTPSIELYVKTKWRGPIFTSAGSNRSCGVAICFRESTVSDICYIHSDIQGRLIICKFKIHDITYTLINTYAPNIATHRKQYFQKLNTVHRTALLFETLM